MARPLRIVYVGAFYHITARGNERKNIFRSRKDYEKFLSYLASVGKMSASSQRQALNALVFLYREVLHMPLETEIAPTRSKRLPRPPTVLTQAEIQRLLAAIEGKHALMAKLLYGSGLRLMECIRLRVQDVDFGQNLIFVRGGKGGKDRTTIIPRNLREELYRQIEAVKAHYLKTCYGVKSSLLTNMGKRDALN
jgi:integrase